MNQSKQQVINHFNQGLSKSEIARVTNLPRTTVRRWIKEYLNSKKSLPEFEVGQRVEWCLYGRFDIYGKNVNGDNHDFGTVKSVKGSLVYVEWESSGKTLSACVDSLRRADKIEQSPEVYEDVPLSEVAIPKINHCTHQEAIDDLRALAEANPERAISRNWYRVHGKYSESAWGEHFGVFSEFKRQAGIVLTRQQHMHERNIAKHVSADHYREMNNVARSYGDKYDKPTNKRYKQAIFVSDMHDKHVDPFAKDVLVDTVKRVQPDVIILGGDLLDCPEFGRYNVDARQWDVVGRIKYLHEEILKPLRDAAPNAQIDYIVGNHEFRIIKHLADNTQALRVVLSDLHGMTLGSLLGLDEFQINLVCKSDLAAYNLSDQHKEIAKNYKVYWDSFVASHEPYGKSLGMAGISGHHHVTRIHSLYNETFGAYSWVESPGMHKLDAEYCHPKWQLGFVVITCDTETKRTVFDVATLSENFGIVGGVFYERRITK